MWKTLAAPVLPSSVLGMSQCTQTPLGIHNSSAQTALLPWREDNSVVKISVQSLCFLQCVTPWGSSSLNTTSLPDVARSVQTEGVTKKKKRKIHIFSPSPSENLCISRMQMLCQAIPTLLRDRRQGKKQISRTKFTFLCYLFVWF